mmetsp:Transcript_15682/g.45288  ORF Transcript_15682/g.45288 Transcript_15682/m.45288 type:complete len:116 (-) Transcript_15682:2087-2434(-)
MNHGQLQGLQESRKKTNAMESKEEIPRPFLSFVPFAMILCFLLEMLLWPFPVADRISRSLVLSILASRLLPWKKTVSLEMAVQVDKAAEVAIHEHPQIETTSDFSHPFLEGGNYY